MDYRSGKKQRRERALRGQGSTGGFSMAETLATVAIIVILLALAVVGIFNLYYSLQQKELDSKAEIIYVAAQDQMTKIMAAGRDSFMAPSDDPDAVNGVIKIENAPGDAPGTSSSSQTSQQNADGGDSSSSDGAGNSSMSASDSIEKGSIAYLKSSDVHNSDKAAYMLFGNGGLDDELLGQNWVIEYNYKSLAVYAVFYNPSDDDFLNKYDETAASSDGHGGYNAYRTYNDRLDALKSGDKRVGYHGGAGSAASSDSSSLSLSNFSVDNGEKLIVDFACTVPSKLSDAEHKVTFMVDLRDDAGNLYTKYYSYGENVDTGGMDSDIVEAKTKGEPGHVYNIGNEYSLRLVLDSLESDKTRFASIYGQGAQSGVKNAAVPGRQPLTPGSDIEISVTAYCAKDFNVSSITQTSRVNSLFDKVEPADSNENASLEAVVTCGRHLQNLDADSGVTERVTQAVQESDINFTKDAQSTSTQENHDWFKTYGGEGKFLYGNAGGTNIPLFKPITNSKLILFRSPSAGADSVVGNFEIKNLYVGDDKAKDGDAALANAGLFGEVNHNMTIEGVRLSSPRVKSPTTQFENAGALIGKAAGGSLTIKDCQVYLGEADRNPAEQGTAQTNVWVSGSRAGGFVGAVENGTVFIERSSASSIIGKNAADVKSGSSSLVGGLIGSAASSNIAVSQSYTDSYLMGGTVGGMVGKLQGAGTNSLSISQSYTVGFLAWADKSSGFVADMEGSPACEISDAYTAMDSLASEQSGGFDSAGGYVPIAPANGHYVNCSYLDFGVDVPTQPSDVESFTSADDISEKYVTDAGPFARGEQVTPFNLMVTLVSYDWPTIAGLKHYGDWTSGFQSGALVYYEQYSDGSFGFDGAGVESTLNHNAATTVNGKKERLAVTGDGYGFVFRTGDAKLDSGVVVTGISTAVKSGSSAAVSSRFELKDRLKDGDKVVSISGKAGQKYQILALPKGIVNTDVVNRDNFYFKVELEGYSKPFYFNPHFALTVVSSNTVPDAPSRVMLRTARQLYNLSEYYGKYRNESHKYTFTQQRNIDYQEYQWTIYTNQSGALTSQKPIGVSRASSFKDTYDGCYETSGNKRYYNEITNISFVAGKDYDCAGFFGFVDSKARVENVTLVTDYAPDKKSNYLVRCSKNLSGNVNAYLGVLAGYSEGQITNCAVSGYYIAGSDGTIRARTNSRVNIGGLVGSNAGTIKDCEADSPRLRMSALYATVNAGGLVGYNSSRGTINNSYALGAIETTDAKGGKVNVAGFAGKNDGIIKGSYAATALEVAGESAESYGFAPKGGSVSKSYYLCNGTYSYLQKMYSYNFTTGSTSGTPITYEKLKKTKSEGEVKSGYTYRYGNTVTAEKQYPYRGVVQHTGDNGVEHHYVHYGDWQDDVDLGTLGVFYWEKEEHGSNNGYHMTYIGSEADYVDGKLSDKFVSGTSLCNAHDDGGIITSYGYGFYVDSGLDVNASWTGIDCSGGNGPLSDITNYNIDVSRALEEQIKSSVDENSGVAKHNLVFYAFMTRPAQNADGGDYIVLDGSDKQNGQLTLSYKYGSSNSESTSYSFELSPLFANAMSLVGGPDDLLKQAAQSPLEASDGMLTNYAHTASDQGAELGKSESTVGADGNQTAGNPYEIRSIDQLQYLNWNGEAKSAHELVTSNKNNNYSKYNYLLYKTDAENPNGTIDSIAHADSRDRAGLRWIQTHDVASAEESSSFTPIAGAATSSGATSYDAIVYAWFGSHYDGQNYTIKNVSISSPSFTVGLFGVTVGANISNMVMYSDNSSKIERATEGAYANNPGAYSVGGLIGTALDYAFDTESVKKSNNYVENCAVSGYDIVDRSSNRQTLGEANVGGLIGVANINLRYCSADVNILEAATFTKGSALWGNFTRIGGLTGGAQGYVRDCYSGGSLTFDKNYGQTIDWAGVKDEKNENKRFYVSVAGIAASAFTSNYKNISGKSESIDGQPHIQNCYTYFSFPDVSALKGKRLPNGATGSYEIAMSTVASLADRADTNSVSGKADAHLTVDNCYYYNQIKTADVEEQYYGSRGSNSAHRDRTEVLGLSDHSYDEMSAQSFVDELNRSGVNSDVKWGTVTTKEGNDNSPVDGKFSFPSRTDLVGKNYPFPTIVRQNNLAYGTFAKPDYAYVHYGNWPIGDASYWENGRDSIDIFADRPLDASGLPEKDVLASKTFTLYVNKKDFDHEPTRDDFKFDPSGAARIAEGADSIVKRETIGNVTKYYVKIEAVKDEGFVTVTLGKTNATFSLEITSNLALSALATDSDMQYDEETGKLFVDVDKNPKTKSLDLKATSENKDCSALLSGWSAASADKNLVEASITGASRLDVTRIGPGEVLVTVTATYKYGENSEANRQMFITVIDSNPVGLSNGVDFNVINNLGKGGTGEEKNYGNDETAPSYELSDEESMYLFTASDEKYLNSQSVVKSVVINEKTYGIGEYKQGDEYYVTIPGNAKTTGSYRYLPIKVAYAGRGGLATAPDSVLVYVHLDNGSKEKVLSSKLYKNTHGKYRAGLKDARLKTLTFSGYSSSVRTTQFYPEGYTYVFETFEQIFRSRDFKLDDGDIWLNSNTEYGVSSGNTAMHVSSNMSFQALKKKELVLHVNGNTSSAAYGTYYIGRNGIKTLKEATESHSYSKASAEGVLSKSGRNDKLLGWYDNSDSRMIINADGKVVASDGSYANNWFKIEDGSLKVVGSTATNFYPARELRDGEEKTWKLVNAIEDGKDYLIVNAKEPAAGSDATVFAASKSNEERLEDNNGYPIYKLSEEKLIVAKAGLIANDNLSEAALWTAKSVREDAFPNMRYFTLKNKASDLYVTDSDLQDNEGRWIVGAIGDISKNHSLSSYSPAHRSYVFIDQGTKAFKTFYTPTSGSFVKSISSGSGLLYTTKESSGVCYLYGEAVHFDWN